MKEMKHKVQHAKRLLEINPSIVGLQACGTIQDEELSDASDDLSDEELGAEEVCNARAMQEQH